MPLLSYPQNSTVSKPAFRANVRDEQNCQFPFQIIYLYKLKISFARPFVNLETILVQIFWL